MPNGIGEESGLGPQSYWMSEPVLLPEREAEPVTESELVRRVEELFTEPVTVAQLVEIAAQVATMLEN